MGPILFVILALDLNTLSGKNQLIKYADDSTLVVPEDSDIGLETEFNNILEWADNNSMVINLPKTKELIFYNPRARPKSFPPPIPTVERVTSAKLLGIYIQDNFKCDMQCISSIS